ncbi:Alpha/Beta hydrolase protein [Gaertneriomyces semiglobifer]|nr:Alpha/Beta hydrolase protein [Gaertneriomyces semiglobifer]
MPPPSQRGALPSPIRTTIHHDPETNRLHLGYITTERYRAPQNPVVLCHGLFGFDVLGPEFMPALQIHYWTGIAKALQDIGCKVHISRVGTVAALKTRAQELRTFLERKVEGQQVNLVAHSMGGLDCRYVITHLPSSKFQVNSLTTVATPHRGSSFMDWCRDAFGVGLLHDYVNKQGDDVVAKYLQAHDGAPSSKEEGKAMARKKQSRMVKANPIVSALCSPLDSPAFANLTRDYCEAFNRVTPDDPNVQYYSYAAVTDVHPLAPLYFSYRIIAEREGANDGLVSLESAKWGTFLGEVQCDHWQLIPPRLRSLVRAGGRGGFDSIGFYLGLVTGLADKGY